MQINSKVEMLEEKIIKTEQENENYIKRKVRNMFAMLQKKVIVFDNGKFAVEIPDAELTEGMGFVWERKKKGLKNDN